MKSRRAALLVSLALLAGSAFVAELTPAGAVAPGCPCVILIEVDGLEPKDVTPENTPFLWELAHPEEGQALEDTRAGWQWQAPRSVMSAGTAANTAALLTGGYPEQARVPADEFLDPEDGATARLEQNPLDGATQIGAGHFDGKSLLEVVPSETETTGKKLSAAFVGNPALSGIADEGLIPGTLKWWPENTPSESPPSPAYCDPPRRLPEDDPDYQPPCSATDLVTLDHAANALGSDGDDVAFTYIHLAELGVIKRRDGDFSPSVPPTEVNSPAAEESIPHALAQTDAAVAQFITRYKDATQSPTTAAKWNDTFVMVVGTHGYETSLPARRLPAPAGAAEPDLEAYVEANGLFEYAPYGSMATIHVSETDPAARREALALIADKLKPGGDVDTACGEPCIQELLYVREDLLPPDTDADTRKQILLSERHPNWHFDHLSRDDTLAPSRVSGELLVVTAPGWGAGRALPTQQTEGEGGSSLPVSDTSDPYLGIAGGPRNRAVAAIVNGPAGDQGVRQVVPARYPVTSTPDTGELDETPDAKFGSVAAANAAPEDDTGEPGYERQPENVDFAPTIAALLGVALDDDQLAGRFLQEAFRRPLAFPNLDVPPPEPEPEPEIVEEPFVEPEPEVIILPPPPPPEPPPPPKTWDYSGLIRNLRAAVGNKRGRIFPNVPPRADLSYLILRADFGKPLASVKLSFYKRQRTETEGRTGAARTVVKTLASFDAFSIKRAKNAKLTLRVPKVFKPTHVGLIVQQARKLSAREAATARRKKQPLFKAYGARVGGIYRIRNARRLHTRAPKRTSKRPEPNRRG